MSAVREGASPVSPTEHAGGGAPSPPRGRRAKAAAAVALLVIASTCLALQAKHLVAARHYGGYLPICRVQTDLPAVALTFDDGPDPSYTPALLALLRQNRAYATFFVLGEHAAEYPELITAEMKAGMEVANHTWSHPHLPALSTAQALEEAARTGRLLGSNSVPEFRAPYGEVTAEQLKALERSVGYRVIHWSSAIDHYVGDMGLSPSEAARSLAASVEPGDIILAHDADVLPKDGGADRQDATEALQLLLPEIAGKGLAVVTVGTLIRSGTPVRASPRPWFWQSGFTCP